MMKTFIIAEIVHLPSEKNRNVIERKSIQNTISDILTKSAVKRK
jgi:hypothetical protein